jgi:ABC-type multidrug transport system fused ATPase/permease subunit
MKPIKMDQFKYTKELGKTNNNIQEICDGISVVKSYNLMGALGEKYYEALHKTFVTSNRNDWRQYNMEPFSHMIGTLPVYIGLCLGGWFVFKGYITLGIMVAFVSIIKKLVEPLSSVYAIIVKGQVAFIGVKRIMYILAAPVE